MRVNAYERVKGVPKKSYFNAPETYDENYTDKVDVWSVGMLFYFLLVGQLPFSEEKFDKVSASMPSACIALSLTTLLAQKCCDL